MPELQRPIEVTAVSRHSVQAVRKGQELLLDSTDNSRHTRFIRIKRFFGTIY